MCLQRLFSFSPAAAVLVALPLAPVVLASAAPAMAQQAYVLVFEGWQRTAYSNGIVAYECVSRGCPANARVSYRRQPHRPVLEMAQFEAHHQRLSREAPASSQGRVSEAKASGFAERAVEGVRVLTLRRDVTWTDGVQTAAIDALLIGPDASFSVVSNADDLADAQADFAQFLPRLIDLVLQTR